LKNDRFVIVVAGATGSGKTSLVNKIAELLENSTIMYYDNYSHLMLTIETNDERLNNETNPQAVIIPRMGEDLEKILKGKSIIDPKTKQIIQPKKFVVIEDPYGRARPDIGPNVDYVVLLDTPLEICLARVILRCFRGRMFTREDGSQIPQEEADSEEKIALIEKFLFGPYFTREFYLTHLELVRNHAEHILDGVKSIDEMAEEVVRKIHNLIKN